MAFYAPLQAQKDKSATQWADSVYQELSLEERIGQLFMVAAYSNKDEAHVKEIETLISKYHIGGLIFFQGGPGRQLNLTNRFQKKSKIPLLIGQDFEWGLGMRLDSTLSFPKQMTLGALQSDSLIFAMGAEIAREMKLIGVHVNFAPVVDINNNPANPVIGYRSFGENKYRVAEKGLAYMNGLQENGIMAVAKHFPGHGDTDTDSHLDLPVLKHSRARLDSLELYPFVELMRAGLLGMMTAHLSIPELDNTENLASTLSPKVVNELLKEELNFQGLVFTDALNMKGVSKYYEPGEVDLMALQAGNDVLLFPEDVPTAIEVLRKAYKKRKINRKDFAVSVKKILKSKYELGALKLPLLQTHLDAKLNTPGAELLIRRMYEGALTLVKDDQGLIPLLQPDTTSMAVLSMGASGFTSFETKLSQYGVIKMYSDSTDAVGLLDTLSKYEVVIVGLHGVTSNGKKDYNIPDATRLFLHALSKETRVVLVHFGNAYAMQRIDNTLAVMLCTYQDNLYSQEAAAQALFGGQLLSGTLPVSVKGWGSEGAGLQRNAIPVLGFDAPEGVGMDGAILSKIDRVVYEALADTMMPGCQILIARKGKVIFEKNYGNLGEKNDPPVGVNTIYDLASITKVAASTQALMFLYDRGLIDLDTCLSTYLPELKGSNKDCMNLRNILTHQAGLTAFIPFWQLTETDEGLDSSYYHFARDTTYTTQISNGLFVNKMLSDTVWQWVIKSELREPLENGRYDYKYSDMGYYLIQKIVAKLLNQPMDEFLLYDLYEPLGMNQTYYLPLKYAPEGLIAPTEIDNYFRNSVIRGYVHDPGSAMIGGVAGHAGLFSTSRNLATLLQMMLQGGTYGNFNFVDSSSIALFTQQQFLQNRRGLGWDKPVLEGTNGPCSMYASKSSYGHSGFTGTLMWADPKYELIYVFLSNRTFPDAANTKLIKNNIRTRIQDIIYESIFAYDRQSNPE